MTLPQEVHALEVQKAAATQLRSTERGCQHSQRTPQQPQSRPSLTTILVSNFDGNEKEPMRFELI